MSRVPSSHSFTKVFATRFQHHRVDVRSPLSGHVRVNSRNAHPALPYLGALYSIKLYKWYTGGAFVCVILIWRTLICMILICVNLKIFGPTEICVKKTIGIFTSFSLKFSASYSSEYEGPDPGTSCLSNGDHCAFPPHHQESRKTGRTSSAAVDCKSRRKYLMEGLPVVAHETARDCGLLLAWRDKKMLVFGWRVEHNLNKKEFSLRIYDVYGVLIL